MSTGELARKKRSKYYRFINSHINRLKSYNEYSLSDHELDKIITELSAVIPKKGVSIQQLNELLDIILDKTNAAQFKTSHKMKLMSILQCFDLIDFDTVLKILNCFKVPVVTVGKAASSRKIQHGLSLWLIANFCNLDWDRRFLLILPVLFNMLFIGYIRENIGTLLVYLLKIGKAEIDSSFQIKDFINKYKIDILSSYLRKDDKVLPLAILFDQYLSAHRDEYSLSTYYTIHNLVSRRLTGWKGPFANASQLAKDRLGAIKVQAILHYEDLGYDTSGTEIAQLHSFTYRCNIVRNAYNSMMSLLQLQSSPLPKRQKTSALFVEPKAEYRPTIDKSFGTFNDLCFSLGKPRRWYNVYQLASLFNEKSIYLDANSGPFDNTPLMFTLLDVLLSLDENSLEKSISILGVENETSEFDGLIIQIAKFTLTMPTILEDRIQFNGTASSLDIVRFLNFKNWSELKPIMVQLFDSGEREKYLSRLILPIYGMLQCWRARLHIDDSSNQHAIIQSINCCIQFIIEKVIKTYMSDFNLNTAFSILWVLHLMRQVPKNYIWMQNLVLPPSIAYYLLFSDNPILIDQFCTHIDYCKTYFSEYGSTYILDRSRGIRKDDDVNSKLSVESLQNLKSLHNSYVMDTCNIIWRNKSFDGGSNATGKGFMMPREFISRLLRLSSYHFTSNNDISFEEGTKQAFNLFYSPAFCSLLYGIIHKMEVEQHTDINIDTVLSKSTFQLLCKKGNWLVRQSDSVEYDKFRALLLDQLSALGLNGVPELLFSSLKSLSRMKLWNK